MTKFLIFAKYATTHRFCLDPALWANFLEPISVGAVTNSHFFDFRRKFRDPSYYFDDLISVFAKYATTHRFCLDPALWAIFFGTDLYGGFHDFSLFWILPKILWPLLLLWWPNFCFCKKCQKSRIWKIMKIFAPPLAITKLFFFNLAKYKINWWEGAPPIQRKKCRPSVGIFFSGWGGGLLPILLTCTLPN